MGADFLFAVARVPDKGTSRDDIADRVYDIPFDKLTEMFEDAGLWWALEAFDGPDYDQGNVDAWMRQRVMDAYDRAMSEPRDIGWFKDKGPMYWVTGGMSWGDTPTDSFDDINLLFVTNVTDDEFYERG